MVVNMYKHMGSRDQHFIR